MPGPASRNLKQVTTYWPKSDTSDFGQESFGAPVKIFGRWSDRAEAVRKSTGEEVTSRAIVFLDRDISPEGYLAKGDWTSEDDPTVVAEAYPIVAFGTIPDVRYMETERRAYL